MSKRERRQALAKVYGDTEVNRRDREKKEAEIEKVEKEKLERKRNIREKLKKFERKESSVEESDLDTKKSFKKIIAQNVGRMEQGKSSKEN